ncbi:MAG: helix-turn-helix domain-containing protein [Gammaproteobacteria bacterium]|nr:MAG: helix-turn-helix domain-containing protein [Gammaproteobacteria bacterium]
MSREPQRAKAPRLTRGLLSRRTGCNIETIRYYEGIGLMPVPQRSQGGHRLYDEGQVKRLTFIRRARELGFSLREIRGLLALVDGGDYSCGQIETLTLEHLGEVRSKIADLRKLERTLADIASQCDGGRVPDCPVIDALFRNAR